MYLIWKGSFVPSQLCSVSVLVGQGLPQNSANNLRVSGRGKQMTRANMGKLPLGTLPHWYSCLQTLCLIICLKSPAFLCLFQAQVKCPLILSVAGPFGPNFSSDSIPTSQSDCSLLPGTMVCFRFTLLPLFLLPATSQITLCWSLIIPVSNSVCPSLLVWFSGGKDLLKGNVIIFLNKQNYCTNRDP